MAVLLSAVGLKKAFGAVTIADDIAFDINDGEVVGVIGPNGAGKTTLFALLSGTVGLDAGKIVFGERDVTNLPTFERARLGIARTYQVPRPFTHMTVADNLKVAALFGGGLEQAECSDWIDQIVNFAGLTKVRGALAGKTLSSRQETPRTCARPRHPPHSTSNRRSGRRTHRRRS